MFLCVKGNSVCERYSVCVCVKGTVCEKCIVYGKGMHLGPTEQRTISVIQKWDYS